PRADRLRLVGGPGGAERLRLGGGGRAQRLGLPLVVHGALLCGVGGGRRLRRRGRAVGAVVGAHRPASTTVTSPAPTVIRRCTRGSAPSRTAGDSSSTNWLPTPLRTRSPSQRTSPANTRTEAVYAASRGIVTVASPAPTAIGTSITSPWRVGRSVRSMRASPAPTVKPRSASEMVTGVWRTSPTPVTTASGDQVPGCSAATGSRTSDVRTATAPRPPLDRPRAPATTIARPARTTVTAPDVRRTGPSHVVYRCANMSA